MSKYNFFLDQSKLALLQAHLRGKVKTKESVRLEATTDKKVCTFLSKLDSYKGHSKRLNQNFVGITISDFWKHLTYGQVYLNSLQNFVQTIYENKVKDELDRLNMPLTWYGSPDEAGSEENTSRFCSTNDEFDSSKSFHCPIEVFLHNQACKDLVEKIISSMNAYQDVARARLQGIPMKDLAQQRGVPQNRLSVYLSREYAKVIPLFMNDYKQLFGS